jgi:hypothetical protein
VHGARRRVLERRRVPSGALVHALVLTPAQLTAAAAVTAQPAECAPDPPPLAGVLRAAGPLGRLLALVQLCAVYGRNASSVRISDSVRVRVSVQSKASFGGFSVLCWKQKAFQFGCRLAPPPHLGG